MVENYGNLRKTYLLRMTRNTEVQCSRTMFYMKVVEHEMQTSTILPVL